MSTFLLEIITPEKRAFQENVDGVTVPTLEGTIGVLPRHERLFTVLADGEVKITRNSQEIYLAIGGGFMEVTEERVSILVSRAVHADELNESEIKHAQAEAQEILDRVKTGKTSTGDFLAAQATLRRSLLELSIIRKRHHRPGVSSN